MDLSAASLKDRESKNYPRECGTGVSWQPSRTMARLTLAARNFKRGLPKAATSAQSRPRPTGKSRLLGSTSPSLPFPVSRAAVERWKLAPAKHKRLFAPRLAAQAIYQKPTGEETLTERQGPPGIINLGLLAWEGWLGARATIGECGRRESSAAPPSRRVFANV